MRRPVSLITLVLLLSACGSTPKDVALRDAGRKLGELKFILSEGGVDVPLGSRRVATLGYSRVGIWTLARPVDMRGALAIEVTTPAVRFQERGAGQVGDGPSPARNILTFRDDTDCDHRFEIVEPATGSGQELDVSVTCFRG
jgi:hypothetical protein